MGNAGVARDYYGILGVATGRRARRDQAGVPQARPRAAPRRQPGRGGAGAVRRGQRRVRGAVRPGEAARSSTSAATRWATAARARRRRPVQRLRARRHHGRLLRRQRWRRRAHPRPAQPGAARRRCADPHARSRWRSAPPGVTRELPSTPPCCAPSAPGQGCAPGTTTAALRHLRRPRRGAERAALVPRPGRHGAAVPDVPRLRRGHPRARAGSCRGDGPGPLAARRRR